MILNITYIYICYREKDFKNKYKNNHIVDWCKSIRVAVGTYTPIVKPTVIGATIGKFNLLQKKGVNYE